MISGRIDLFIFGSLYHILSCLADPLDDDDDVLYKANQSGVFSFDKLPNIRDYEFPRFIERVGDRKKEDEISLQLSLSGALFRFA